MKRILVIEDNKHDLNILKKRIFDTFGTDKIAVFPDTEEEFIRINKEINNLNGNDFSFIRPEGIDIFIIDNCLINNRDNTGVDIINMLHDKKKSNLILLTNDVKTNDKIDKIKSKASVFYKYDYRSKEDILNYIESITGLKRINSSKKKYTVEEFNDHIHQVIGFTLKILTVLALIFGVFRLSLSGVETFSHKNTTETVVVESGEKLKDLPQDKTMSHNDRVNDTDDSSMPPHKKEEENKESLALLELAESAFLNFLPFFIIFSFMGYYNSYLKNVLLGSNAEKVDAERSIETLKISKILFISSIIATLIIKIIEVLMREEFDPLHLIPHGVLLIILMLYYVFLEKDSHKGHT